MVKLLKSKRVPEDRQGTIVDLIGKRGTVEDLEYIYQQALSPDGFPTSVRVKALEALAGAAANRNLKPTRDLEKLTPLVRDADVASRRLDRKTCDSPGRHLEARAGCRGARC